MYITYLGYIAIPVGLIVFFVKPQILMYLTIFFSTFTAASIFNRQASTTGIQPVYFFGFLWLLYLLKKYTLEIVKNKGFTYFKTYYKYKSFIISICIFAIIVMVTLTMPIVLKGRVYVNYPDSNILKPLIFRSMNVTQYIYLFFMMLIAVSFVFEIKNICQMLSVIKTFLYSSIFAAIWGVIQFCMFYLKIEYPYYLFNNNISYSQQYNQMIFGIKRVNSIAVEPSMFSVQIIMALSVVLFCWLGNYSLFENKRKNDIILVFSNILFILVAILTTSTSAYVGLMLLLLTANIYAIIKRRKNKSDDGSFKKMLIINMILIFSIVLIFIICTKLFHIYWGTLYDVIKDVTVNKKNIESGKQRTDAIITSLNIFKNYPILGVGWGSHRSFDLITNLLANTGLLGLMSFSYMIILSLIYCVKNVAGNMFLNIGIACSICVGIILLGLSIPDLTFTYLWIFIAVAVVSGNMKN